ncbi:hypothetical protein [Paenisporosarcina cavernae]|uniref:Lipoprotein n=1 Tax=Paenisporosarcina cavernae TaxID=2320858 RepID=A0A385YX55_9BACL|nr:hypothetical protein [Paenisporosarcina cavernae]AYC30092.1 hypothetical protein D3873_09480 [Paenisporosarcina cavernae]
MKKIIVLLGVIVLTLSACSNTGTEEEKNKRLEITNMQLGIGAIDNTDQLEIQKFSYDLTISNEEKLALNEESIEIVLTDWMMQHTLEDKMTEKNFESESIHIKGYVTFNTKGLSKKEIIDHSPFIEGVKMVNKAGEEIFLKSQFL